MINEDRRCNDLTGKEWLSNSFSIWRNLNKTKEEKEFDHPAYYPVSLCEKLIRTFSKRGSNVLDPFNGIGSTMVAAHNLGCSGTGIDLSIEFTETARKRVQDDPKVKIVNGNSLRELDRLSSESFDLCITSPPYWDILNMRRSVDKRNRGNYSDSDDDMGNITDYDDFIKLLGDLFEKVRRCLKLGGYCIVNVMDIRKKSKFYPLHSDLAMELQRRGYTFDDIIIWDRQSEYNNMRPLGYPYKFRINKVHEYILIFIKE